MQSADPEFIYVPVYNQVIIYGVWPYPSYLPYYYYPPGYVARRAIWFGVGVAVGSAIWGNCNWGRNTVNINVNRYNNFNRTNIKNRNWNHKPKHRKGVPYRNASVRKKYNRSPSTGRTREEFRGRTKSGDAIKKRTTPAKKRDVARKTDIKKKRPQQTPSKARKQSTAKKQRTSKPRRSTSKSRSSRRPSAYDGVGRGKQVKRNSSRGRSSRQASVQRSSRSRGGGARRSGGRRR